MKPGKVVKIMGGQFNPASMNEGKPTRMSYGQKTTTPQTTAGESRIENVFIPYYDRRGFITDNAARTATGQMFVIPSGCGVMEQRDLGA
jgi:hypothetical protein